jgi:hypothetical protein
MILFLLLCVSVSVGNLMRDVSVLSNQATIVQQSKRDVAVTCKSPGGHLSITTGDCVCCPGYSGLGCANRDRCYDVSCSNGGYCDGATGYCSCPQGWTGPRCNVPTCSHNGLFDNVRQVCNCHRGWGGPDCSQCSPSGTTNANGVSYTWVCVPSKATRYMLMNLPTTYAQKLIAGTVKADASLSYNALVPGGTVASVDGKMLDCACQPIDNRKKRITPADLDLYNQTITACIASSTLTMQQMQELENLWATCVSMEQQGTLNNTWYILGIVFIVLFGVLLIGIVIYCVFINYTKEQEKLAASSRPKTRRRTNV